MFWRKIGESPDNHRPLRADRDMEARTAAEATGFGLILLTLGLKCDRLSPVDRSTERSTLNGGC